VSADVVVSGDVRFFEDGVVRLEKSVPIIDSLADSHSIVGEELRLLRAKMQTLNDAGQPRCVGVTSALPAEGKSTISLGLAAAQSRDPGARVLLVEADLRRPSLSSMLGLPPSPGLSEWLNGGLDQVPVRRVEPGGFALLSAGETPLERPEALGSALMEALLASARRAFTFVLLDIPPVLPVADTILLQDLVDGFVVVARSRATSREAIREALGRLRGEKILGLVLNDHREYKHSYRSYGYDRYGMRYDPRTPAKPTRS
jgi:capsular exopolysaccharide synthesis family protein